MTVQLMWATPEADKQIAFMARVSNPDNQDNTEFKRLLNYLMKHNHVSPFEMASMCVQIDTTRDISRQILRHHTPRCSLSNQVARCWLSQSRLLCLLFSS